jgi:hypothetical protein
MNDITKSSVTSRFVSVHTRLVLSLIGLYRVNESYLRVATSVAAGNDHCYVYLAWWGGIPYPVQDCTKDSPSKILLSKMYSIFCNYGGRVCPEFAQRY